MISTHGRLLAYEMNKELADNLELMRKILMRVHGEHCWKFDDILTRIGIVFNNKVVFQGNDFLIFRLRCVTTCVRSSPFERDETRSVVVVVGLLVCTFFFVFFRFLISQALLPP